MKYGHYSVPNFEDLGGKPHLEEVFCDVLKSYNDVPREKKSGKAKKDDKFTELLSF